MAALPLPSDSRTTVTLLSAPERSQLKGLSEPPSLKWCWSQEVQSLRPTQTCCAVSTLARSQGDVRAGQEDKRLWWERGQLQALQTSWATAGCILRNVLLVTRATMAEKQVPRQPSHCPWNPNYHGL